MCPRKAGTIDPPVALIRMSGTSRDRLLKGQEQAIEINKSSIWHVPRLSKARVATENPAGAQRYLPIVHVTVGAPIQDGRLIGLWASNAGSRIHSRWERSQGPSMGFTR
jgi:hypothetical protein